MPWWNNSGKAESPQVVLFQVDLGGHSRWVQDQPTDREPANARAEFSMILQRRLRLHGYDRLYWLGDGGLFARKHDGVADANSACEAADAAFELFEEWKKSHWDLRLRACATYLDSVLIDPDPGNWLSANLNAFLKFERSIALPNAFVITDNLKRKMDEHSTFYKRFKDRRSANLGNEEQITTWIDSHHPWKVAASPESFSAWWVRKRTQGLLPPASSENPQAFEIGDSVILHTALDLTGYPEIRTVSRDPAARGNGIEPEDRDRWSAERERLLGENVQGTIMCVVHFQGEFTDDPNNRLDWRAIDYVDFSAFSYLMSDGPTRARYLPKAREVIGKGTEIPNSLSNHIVVTTRNEAGGRDVIIAHRKKSKREGGYYHNVWSVSIEEQFLPSQTRRGNRTTGPDSSIAAAVIRGVQEELTGPEYHGATHVSIHAFQMEKMLLNFGFLAIVHLPDLTFKELADLWPAAPDSQEQDAIAALPLDEHLLRRCLEQDALPLDVWNQIERRGGSGLTPPDHKWHPTSHGRLALSLWHLATLRQSI
jgi:hypothetical protein